jgi:CheY-like chemotaxis protein
MPVLRIKLPDNQGEITHVLAGDRITIGRRPENTIQIIDRTVSAHHAELISINGHYRLHDLGSTNLTCVDGQPVSDYHLHQSCKVSFGSVDCAFSPDNPVNTGEKSEYVPTRAELEYLRRENQDLEARMAAMQKQIDILSSARLMTKDTQQLGVTPDAHRRVQMERDEARNQAANLRLDVENLRSDIAALMKERDALRLAWETVKRERDEAFARAGAGAGKQAIPSSVSASPSTAPATSPSRTAPVQPAQLLQSPAPLPPLQVPQSSKPSPINGFHDSIPDTLFTPTGKPPAVLREGDTVCLVPPSRQSVDHRAMATVLMKALAALKAMRASLEALQPCENSDEASQNITNLSQALAEALAPVNGHSAQRLAAACAALVEDSRSRPSAFEPQVTRTLLQAAEVIGALLDPRLFRKAAEAPIPRALVIDDDLELLDTVAKALKTAEIRTTPCQTPTQGIEMLEKEGFDLVLLDVGLPDLNGIDVCSRIRELPTHRTTPVVFMTGDSTDATRAQSSLNGGDDFMPKPFNVRELTVKAATWVARQQCGIRN